MAISMLDQMLFRLSCGHDLVLGRVAKADKWTCEQCGKTTALNAGSYKAALDKDIDTANQIDLQEKAKGHTIERL